MKPRLTEDILIEMGFQKIQHFTVTRAMIYPLGRRRHLSLGSVGTPNEMLFICESDINDEEKITDLICLHNYDYDGFLHKRKLELLIQSIGKFRKK